MSRGGRGGGPGRPFIGKGAARVQTQDNYGGWKLCAWSPHVPLQHSVKHVVEGTIATLDDTFWVLFRIGPWSL
jgi:hypothetical protein